MNIFVLHSDPEMAALYHCDQHLNKMIVESAQMLSVAALNRPEMASIHRFMMKPAYQNHPCTIWVGERLANMHWLCQMAKALESLRDSSRENAASPVIRAVHELVLEQAGEYNAPSNFTFCGPEDLREAADISTVTRYRALYFRKAEAWFDKPHSMSYRGRMLPEFLWPLADKIPHTYEGRHFSEERQRELFLTGV